MGLKRILILVRKDLVHGSKSFLFVFAVATPILTSLVLSLLFGRLLVQSPRLGIVDEDGSQLAARAAESDAVMVRFYSTDGDLRQAVASGQVDIGLNLPGGFDRKLLAGETTRMNFYIWGESRIQNRMAVAALVSNTLVEVLNLPVPVEVVPESLGKVSLPWFDRLLPLLVLMAVLLGGMLLPAAALVEEKQRQTLRALTVTPVSLGEVLLSKALLGIVLSMSVALLILLLNRVWSSQPALLLFVLLLSALLAAVFGLLLGTLVKDITGLLGTMKGMVLVLYAPGIIPLFPQIPQWIAKLSPTYYMFNPILQIAQEDASWAQVQVEVLILIGLILLTGSALSLLTRRKAALAAYS
jgi:ABC-2 type transport system permease protein